VRVRYGEHDLEVEVTDAGIPGRLAGRARTQAADSGHGIHGMTERVNALGGTLRAEPRPGGGFGVLARLPLDGSGR
jgi:signal transduction histidine kinase